MKKSGIIALLAVTATVAGICYFRRKPKKPARPLHAISQFPFIDNTGDSEMLKNKIFSTLNFQQRRLRESHLRKKLQELCKADYRGLSRVEKQQTIEEINCIIRELVALGYVIVPSTEMQNTINTYYYAALKDMEMYLQQPDNVLNVKAKHQDYDVYDSTEACVIATVAVNIIRQNIKKGIFPIDESFRVAMLAKLLDRVSSENAIYTLYYIVNYTDIHPREGWVLMLDAYKLKYCIEEGIDYNELDEDTFFMALEIDESVLDYMMDGNDESKAELDDSDKDEICAPAFEDDEDYIEDDDFDDIDEYDDVDENDFDDYEDDFEGCEATDMLDDFVANTGRTVIQFPKGYSPEGKSFSEIIKDGVDYTEALSEEEYNQFQEGRNFDKPLEEGTYTLHRGMIVAPAGFEGTIDDALAYTDSLSDEEYAEAVQNFTELISELGESIDLNALLDDANKTKTPRFVFGDDDTGLIIAPVRGMRMPADSDAPLLTEEEIAAANEEFFDGYIPIKPILDDEDDGEDL